MPGLFGNLFSEFKRFYNIPKRVQDIIHIQSIDLETGIFYHGKNTYSKQYFFSDVNYETLSEENKREIKNKYCAIIILSLQAEGLRSP